jgi:hypothetical protein
MMALQREGPHFLGVSRDGSSWMLRAQDAAWFRGEWMRGAAFWQGVDLWEQPVTVKLADVVGMIEKSAESIAWRNQEAEEERARSVVEGG